MKKKKQIFTYLLLAMVLIASFFVLNWKAFWMQILYRQGMILQISEVQIEKMSLREDRLIIPKINVNAPLVLSRGESEKEIQGDLKNGVVYHLNTALPGKAGIGVITGLSSGLPWESEYRYAFSLLDKLEGGDQIYIFYQGQKFIYKVDKKEIIVPRQLVSSSTEKENRLILTTCWPIGTCFKRVLIEAKLEE